MYSLEREERPAASGPWSFRPETQLAVCKHQGSGSESFPRGPSHTLRHCCVLGSRKGAVSSIFFPPLISTLNQLTVESCFTQTLSPFPAVPSGPPPASRFNIADPTPPKGKSCFPSTSVLRAPHQLRPTCFSSNKHLVGSPIFLTVPFLLTLFKSRPNKARLLHPQSPTIWIL